MKMMGTMLSLVLLGCASRSTCTVGVLAQDNKRYELFEKDDALFVKAPDAAPIKMMGCEVETQTSFASPSGAKQATLLTKNCGATVDFSTQVLIEESGKPQILAIFSGRPKLQIQWISDTTLKIETPALPIARIFRKEERGGQVTVAYSTNNALDSGETPRQKLDQANQAFGKLGYEAGLPKELLQRSAGWAQSAAGLSRSGWGKWNDNAQCL